MNGKEYSQTWSSRSQKIKLSFKNIDINNFYLYSSFNGLYDNPSPFIYSKNLIAKSQKQDFINIRKYLRILKNSVNYKVRISQLKRNKTLEKLKSFLPPIDKMENFQKILQPFYTKYEGKKVNGPFLKCSEQALNINSVVKFENINIICEIGGGFGAMAEIIIKKYQPNYYIIIDLPETLKISNMYLNNLFPGKVNYFNQQKKLKKNKNSTNILLVDVKKYSYLKSFFPKIDLFINSNSFGEMNIETVREYFLFIETYSNVYLSNTNKDYRKEGNYIYTKKTYPYNKNWIEKFSNYQKLDEFKHNLQLITFLP